MNAKSIIALLFFFIFLETGMMIFQHQNIKQRNEMIENFQELQINTLKSWKHHMVLYVDFEKHPECYSTVKKLEQEIK